MNRLQLSFGILCCFVICISFFTSEARDVCNRYPPLLGFQMDKVNI